MLNQNYLFYLNLLCMDGHFAYMYSVHYVKEQYQCRPKESHRAPGIGIIDACEPPCQCFELNLSTLEKQQSVLLLLSIEPFL